MHYCTGRLLSFWSRATRIVSHCRLRPCACITRDWSYKKSPLAVRAALDHKSNKAQLGRLWSLDHKSKDSCVLVCTERVNGTEPIYLDSLVLPPAVLGLEKLLGFTGAQAHSNRSRRSLLIAVVCSSSLVCTLLRILLVLLLWCSKSLLIIPKVNMSREVLWRIINGSHSSPLMAVSVLQCVSAINVRISIKFHTSALWLWFRTFL